MNLKDQLKDISIDLVADSLGLGLQKHGTNLQGECPSGHGSKGRRCFSLNLKGNYFNCFSCGKAGDVIDLVELTKGIEFIPAMKWLAQEFRPDLLPELEKSKFEPSPEKREYYQRASLYDLIFKYGQELLYQETGKEALRYLTEERGYSLENLKQTDWIYWLPEKDIRAYLKQQQPEAEEQIKALKLSGYYGDNFRLAFPYRDRRGVITSFIKRATAPKGISVKTYDGKEHEEIRFDSTPANYKEIDFESKADLFNLHRCKGLEELLIIEGYPDALYFPTIGLKNVVAVGQGLLSKTHLEGLQAFGVKRVIISFDNDQVGPENTAKALDVLRETGIRAFIIDPPLLAPHKDPDELVKAKGLEAFKKLLANPEASSRWLARRIVGRHDVDTDIGRERAIDEALEACYSIKDRLDQRIFKEAFGEVTGIYGEEMLMREEAYQEEASRKKQEKTFNDLASRIQAKARAGDFRGAEEEVSRGLQFISQGKDLEIPPAYTVDELMLDIKGTKDGLRTGYDELDNRISIPQGAITIIAGRPGHGKTTLQLNLLINMLKEYPERKFYFFSYEEAKKWLAVKIIMNLSGVFLNEANLGAYINYFKEKRNTDYAIEVGISEYEKLVNSGRLVIIDQMMPGEELASLIGYLPNGGQVGAVFIDYIQKIPLREANSGQRYQEIKRVSELILTQAVAHDIPIILGAQLGRPSKTDSGAKVVKLENLRESGDIEQDANLVLGLYNDSVVKAEDSEEEVTARKVDLDIHILKNRAGISGKKVTMTFDRPILKIKDKRKRVSSY